MRVSLCTCFYVNTALVYRERHALTRCVHVRVYVCVQTGSGTRLRVTNTTASEQGSTFTDNEASDRGGAIFARAIRTFDVELAEFSVRHTLTCMRRWVVHGTIHQ